MPETLDRKVGMTVTVPIQLLTRLDQAVPTGQSRSGLVVQIITDHLDQEDQK